MLVLRFVDHLQDQTGIRLRYSGRRKISTLSIPLGGDTLFWLNIGPAFPFRIYESIPNCLRADTRSTIRG